MKTTLKSLLIPAVLILIVSCSTLGYDPHTRPVPDQPGRAFIANLNKEPSKNSVIIPLYSIEKPVNHESGWDRDDLVLVFKSPIIDINTSSGQWSWGSNSSWTRFRLNSGTMTGYKGRLSGRILPGEIRLYCGTRGQFLVNLNTIYMIFSHEGIQ